MTDLALVPAACYPVYPAVAARGPLAPRRRHDRCRAGPTCSATSRRGDPGAAADVPHARARPDRRARRGRWSGATGGATAALELLRGLGLDAACDIASDPFFGRTGRMLAASQREQALKFEILVQIAGPSRPRSPRSTTTRTISRTCYGIDPCRRRRSPTPPASASGSSGSSSRCSGPTASTRRRGPTRCATSCGPDDDRHDGPGQPVRPRSGRPTGRIPSTASDRTYPETNCYTDILIELLHARGDEPLAALGVDWSGWTSRATSGRSSSPTSGDLEALFGIDIHEMQPYRPLPHQIAEQHRRRPDDDRRARRVVPARHGVDQLPGGARQDVGHRGGDRRCRRAPALLPQRLPVRARGRGLPRHLPTRRGRSRESCRRTPSSCGSTRDRACPGPRFAARRSMRCAIT